MKHLSAAIVFFITLHYVAWFSSHGYNLSTIALVLLLGLILIGLLTQQK